LSDFRGRIVILNFWSAECPWAERADRELLSYLQGWGDRVVLLTIAANTNEPDELLAAAARERGLPFVLRGSPRILEEYAAEATPHLFVVDRTGLLRYRGALDNVTFRLRIASIPYLKDAVEALLIGGQPDPADTPAYGCAIIRHLPDSC